MLDRYTVSDGLHAFTRGERLIALVAVRSLQRRGCDQTDEQLLTALGQIYEIDVQRAKDEGRLSTIEDLVRRGTRAGDNETRG